MSEHRKPLFLFDGVCNFCNDTVLFLIDRDPSERLSFAPLQSELAQQLLRKHGLDGPMSTSVLIDGSRAYANSDAVLRTMKMLRWPWPLLFVAITLPRSLRDAAYRWFAARRYALFGKSESCRIPTPALRRRFVA